MDDDNNKNFDVQKFVGFDPSKIVELSERLMEDINKRGGMKVMLGPHLFELIANIKKYVMNNDFMKEEGIGHVNDLIQMAQRDVTLLSEFQIILAQITSAVRNEKTRHFFDKNIASSLEQLISKQAGLVKKIPAPIETRPYSEVKKEFAEDCFNILIEKVKNEEYPMATVMILSNYLIIKKEQSKKLYDQINKVSSINTKEGIAFKEILEHRLFSKHSREPQKIEYRSLKNNPLLDIPDVKAIKYSDPIVLNMLLEDAVKYHEAMTETKLKENFHAMIIKEIDAQLELLSNNSQ